MNAAKIGTGMAALCAVHCLALPVLAGASCCAHETPLGHPLVEAGMIGAAGIVGFVTLGGSYLQHRRPIPLSLLVAGLVGMIGSHVWLSGSAATAASLLGALFLVTAQFLNRRCPARCCAGETSVCQRASEQGTEMLGGTPVSSE